MHDIQDRRKATMADEMTLEELTRYINSHLPGRAAAAADQGTDARGDLEKFLQHELGREDDTALGHALLLSMPINAGEGKGHG